MKALSKILIAYDDSEGARSAIADLKLAGLGQKIEARVLTVADPWIVPVEIAAIATDVLFAGAYALNHNQTADSLRDAKTLAEKGAQLLRKQFPKWKVTAVASLDTPAKGILSAAEKWKPGLIVVGSQGHSALGRLILGSVSHRVLTHATRNVRIARLQASHETAAPRVLIAVDGSKDAEAMLQRVASRAWPANAEFRVVVVIDYRLSLIHEFQNNSAFKELASLPQRLAAEAKALLLKRGLEVTTVIREGDPRREIQKEIKRFKATTLFLGSRGLGAIGRFLLGSVSSNLAEHAPCSVEVDRR